MLTLTGMLKMIQKLMKKGTGELPSTSASTRREAWLAAEQELITQGMVAFGDNN